VRHNQRNRAHVRFGSLAAAAAPFGGVRFTPESGREGGRSACPLRAKSGLTASFSVRICASSISKARFCLPSLTFWVCRRTIASAIQHRANPGRGPCRCR
jgi:hypothetical protein